MPIASSSNTCKSLDHEETVSFVSIYLEERWHCVRCYWRMHRVVACFGEYYSNSVRIVSGLAEKWNSPSTGHDNCRKWERNHLSCSSTFDWLCSRHRDSMEEWNRKHSHHFHSVARRKKTSRSNPDREEVETYLSIDVFDYFIQILEPFVCVLIVKITTHGHHDMVRGVTECLKISRLAKSCTKQPWSIYFIMSSI